jgi:hypothetical protein
MTTRTPATTATAAPPNWPPFSQDIPSGANVVLGFHGLLCFCHRHGHSDRNCEVGVHNRSASHNLSISVYRVLDTFNPPYNMDMGIDENTLPFAGPFVKGALGSLNTNIVRFDVDEPREITGVKYFHMGSVDKPRDHPNNFRHIVDLEHDFHPGIVLNKIRRRMGPRLRINNGLFYTLCRTETQFERVVQEGPAQNPVPIGSVALMVGANIYLENDGKVTLKMPGDDDVELKASQGKYFVLIDNGCRGCTGSDVLRYYDVIDSPPAKFDLRKKSTGTGSPAPGSPCEIFLPQVNLILKDAFQPFIADDTPCGAAGFGLSGSIT